MNSKPSRIGYLKCDSSDKCGSCIPARYRPSVSCSLIIIIALSCGKLFIIRLISTLCGRYLCKNKLFFEIQITAN